MPYSIRTKDGIQINNIPDDVPPDSPILKQRVAEARAGKSQAVAATPQLQPDQNTSGGLPPLPEFKGNINALDEIGASPEFSEMSTRMLKASAATNLVTDQRELGEILRNVFPGSTLSQSGESIAITFPSGGTYSVNKPGLSGTDVAQFATRALAFTPAGRGIVGAGLAGLAKLGVRSAATEGVLQLGENALGGDVDTREIVTAGIAGPAGQAVGAKVIAPAAKAAPALIKRAFRGGEAGRQKMADVISDFAEFGASPTMGQATRSRLQQGLETLSSKTLGGRPILNSLDDTAIKMKARLGQIADDISPVRGEEEAGAVIKRGILGDGGFIDRFKNQSGQLWKKVDGLIDDGKQISPEKTLQTLDDLTNETEVGKLFNTPLIQNVRSALAEQGDQIDYKTFREMRSAVGRKLASNDLVSDAPRADLKRLYGAISEDLRAVAASSGDDAVKALNRANNFTRSGHNRIDTFVERVAKKADLDKVFNAMAKGGEGTKAINAVKQSLKPEEWEAVTANVVRRLGRAASGQQDDLGEVFSVSKFLTDWDKLGSSKKVLFSGSPKLNAYRKNMDKIASAASVFKEDVAAMANPSGTAQAAANITLVGAGGAAAITGNAPALGVIVTAVGANNGAARLMTNPDFVRWLSEATTTPSLPAHIARLATLAKSNDLDEEALELIETLQDAAKQQDQN